MWLTSPLAMKFSVRPTSMSNTSATPSGSMESSVSVEIVGSGAKPGGVMVEPSETDVAVVAEQFAHTGRLVVIHAEIAVPMRGHTRLVSRKAADSAPPVLGSEQAIVLVVVDAVSLAQQHVAAWSSAVGRVPNAGGPSMLVVVAGAESRRDDSGLFTAVSSAEDAGPFTPVSLGIDPQSTLGSSQRSPVRFASASGMVRAFAPVDVATTRCPGLRSASLIHSVVPSS